MKKAIVISLVALLVNSAGILVSAQALPPATAKDFPAAYDLAKIGKNVPLLLSVSSQVSFPKAEGKISWTICRIPVRSFD